MVALLFALIGLSMGVANTASATEILYDNASDGSPILPLIQSAKKSIDIEIYSMKDQGVINALKSAVGRGVKLRIIQTPNPVADSCPVFKPNTADTTTACLAVRSFVSFVRHSGGQYEGFSFDLCGTAGHPCYEHGKMMIIDSNKAMISTGNFDPSNLCDLSETPAHCNRDFSVVTTDAKSVKAYGEIFAKDMIASEYDLQTILESAPKITVSPLSLDPIVAFIHSAKKSLQIENQYLKDPTMNAEIISAAKRGVKVFVMVSSVTAFGKLDPTEDASKIEQWESTFKSFDSAGITSRIFDDAMKVNHQPGYLHAKTILVDGLHAWVGSVNGSTKSLTDNREFGYFSDDKVFVKHLGEVMFSDFSNPNAESWIQSLNCKKDSCTSPVIDPSSNDDPDGG